MNKRINLLLIVVTMVLNLISCGEILKEADALTKNQKGLDYLNSGQYELAIKTFKEALSSPDISNETKAQILRNTAQTFNESKLQDSSLHYSFLAAKCYKEGSYNYLINMADVELLTGKTGKAITKLEQAIKMNGNALAPNNSLGLIYLGDYGLEYRNLKKALAYNKKAYEINNDRITEDVLGRTYFEIGNLNKAEYHYERLCESYPGILQYALNLGMIKYKKNKKEEAEKLWRHVISSDSTYNSYIEAFKDNEF